MTTPWKTHAATVMFVAAVATSGAADEQALWFINDSGVRGGLVVHVGCGDGELTAALRVNDRYVIHGLATDEASYRAARRTLASTGLYGKLSVDRLSIGKLPYIDNLVNLLLLQESETVSRDKVMRVLAPNGVAYFLGDGV